MDELELPLDNVVEIAEGDSVTSKIQAQLAGLEALYISLVDDGACRSIAVGFESVVDEPLNVDYPIGAFTTLPSNINFDVACEGIVTGIFKIIAKLIEAALKVILAIIKSTVFLISKFVGLFEKDSGYTTLSGNCSDYLDDGLETEDGNLFTVNAIDDAIEDPNKGMQIKELKSLVESVIYNGKSAAHWDDYVDEYSKRLTDLQGVLKNWSEKMSYITTIPNAGVWFGGVLEDLGKGFHQHASKVTDLTIKYNIEICPRLSANDPADMVGFLKVDSEKRLKEITGIFEKTLKDANRTTAIKVDDGKSIVETLSEKTKSIFTTIKAAKIKGSKPSLAYSLVPLDFNERRCKIVIDGLEGAEKVLASHEKTLLKELESFEAYLVKRASEAETKAIMGELKRVVSENLKLNKVFYSAYMSAYQGFNGLVSQRIQGQKAAYSVIMDTLRIINSVESTERKAKKKVKGENEKKLSGLKGD